MAILAVPGSGFQGQEFGHRLPNAPLMGGMHGINATNKAILRIFRKSGMFTAEKAT